MNYDLEKLKRPAPFEPGNMTLWENGYIASNVLKKHLQPDIDSGSRKKTTIISAANWISDKNPLKGNLLDIGCGPGLYARLLENSGFCYYGIDISEYQIAFANKNYAGSHIRFETRDLRKMEPDRPYHTVLMLYGIYSFYQPDERAALLKTIKASLAPGGTVVVEVFTEAHYMGREESSDWEYIEERGFWSDKPYLELNAFYRYDDLKLVLVQAAKISDEIKVWNSWIQTFTPETLESEFKQAGFTGFEFYSSCMGDAYCESADVLCMIAK